MVLKEAILPGIILLALFTGVAITGCSAEKKQPTAAAKPLVNTEGTWSGSAQQTGSANPTFTLKLNQKENGSVWGTITSMDATFEEANIAGGIIRDSTLTFSATANGPNPRQGRTFSFEAEVVESKMEGTWKDILARNWGSFSLTREGGSAAAATPKKAPESKPH
jgi:hypothetical protein